MGGGADPLGGGAAVLYSFTAPSGPGICGLMPWGEYSSFRTSNTVSSDSLLMKY